MDPSVGRAWYRVAAVLVSLSEHEVFCVPLLEAMSWDVPVAAYACANIPATLAGAGVLLRGPGAFLTPW